jgi:hypothetical protein
MKYLGGMGSKPLPQGRLLVCDTELGAPGYFNIAHFTPHYTGKASRFPAHSARKCPGSRDLPLKLILLVGSKYLD